MTAAARGDLRWRNAIIAIFLLGGVGLSTWGPRLPSIRADLHTSDPVIGLLVAGTTVGAVFGLAGASAIHGWLGARRALLALFWIIAVGIAVIGVGASALHSLPVTGVGFVVAGFGIGVADVLMNVEGSAVEGRLRRTVMPLMHGAWSAGAVAAAGIGAACAALTISPLWQFTGTALLIGVAATVATRFIPDAPLPDENLARPPVAERVRSWFRGWRDLRLLLIGLVMLGVELGEGSANNWLTLAAHDSHGVPDAIAALFFAVFAVSEMLARILGGPVIDRIGRVAAVRVTTAAGVVGLVLFILGGPVWVVLLGALLWAVGVSMGFPLGMSAAAESGPNPAPRVSVVASLGYLANLVGPPVVGALAGALGLLGALWLLAAFLGIAFLASGALARRP